MKRGERPNVLNKTGKIVLRRLDTKKEKSPQGNPHTVSKPRKGHEKLFKMFKKIGYPSA